MFHNTILETNLGAYTHNISLYKSFLKDGTKMMLVVKAFGYGTGAIRLSKHLERIGTDYLAVAFIDEGIELRKAGITTPILVFNPDLNYLKEILEYNIEPSIFDLSHFEMLEKFDTNNIKVHIKLDTGMKRLGFVSEEIDELIYWIKKLNIKVLSIFSHLAVSEDEGKNDFTIQQIELFSELYDKISKEIGYKPIKHILNSSGIVKHSKYQFDMVRLGIGMHSDDMSGVISNKLRAVHTLKAPISQIKRVKANEGIGYGNRCKKGFDRKIAIIPIGYADGIHRQAGNSKYKVWINGSFAPIVGNINMDMSFIDISKLEDVGIGDMVEIFGEHAKITDLALAADTISYELLTRLSSRVKRIEI